MHTPSSLMNGGSPLYEMMKYVFICSVGLLNNFPCLIFIGFLLMTGTYLYVLSTLIMSNSNHSSYEMRKSMIMVKF
jgi:hypothetical protein